MPGITYQLGIEVGGRTCRGASFPGRVGIVFGQNDDVAWSLTNTMADVMDLFVERVDGDEYEFDGELRPLELTEEEIAVKGRAEPERLHGPRAPTTARSSTRRCGAEPDEPLALRWSALELPCVTEASLGVLRVRSGPELVDSLAPHNAPVSNLVWADRHGSIGYKVIGRVPAPRAATARTCRSRAGPASTSGTAGSPTTRCPSWSIPSRATSSPPTTGSPPRTTRTTSPATGSTATGRAGSRTCSPPATSTTSTASSAMQTDMLSIPGLETAHRLARLRPRDQRETAAIERLRSWDGAMGPDSVAATIYQAFTLRLRARGGARGDRRPRPRRALARPRRQRLS